MYVSYPPIKLSVINVKLSNNKQGLFIIVGLAFSQALLFKTEVWRQQNRLFFKHNCMHYGDYLVWGFLLFGLNYYILNISNYFRATFENWPSLFCNLYLSVDYVHD